VAKTFVQRGRPAETVPDVIMVIFAITTLVPPTWKAGGRSCPGHWPPRSACRVCTSVRTFHWTSSRGGSRHIDRERAQPGVRHARHQVQDSQREPVPV